MIQRRLIALLLGLLGAMVAPGNPVAAQASGARCFVETGHCIAGRIAEFWERHGGLPIFGFPISPLLSGEGETRMQWFERARLEWRPDQAPPFDVRPGPLGAEALAARGGAAPGPGSPGAAPGCRFFSESGYSVCEPILSAWRAQGLELDGRPGWSEAENAALFGLPLSGPQEERLSDGRIYTVQWFERARFEIHVTPRGPEVRLGLLGREARPATGGQPLPQIAWGPCPFTVPARARVDCGTLIVPLERDRPGSRSAALAFAIFRDPRPAPDPIVYLSGGPGSPALAGAPALWRAWQPFVAGRDLIVVDQRGTGASWPDLRCPEVRAFAAEARRQGLTGRAYAQGEAAALLACRERIAAGGTPLRAFTTAAAAADLRDLRLALGYTQWNIFGISYGTRLALALLRDDPAGARSVILDSPYPPQESLYAGMPANLNRALGTLFADCAAQPGCAAAYPDLEERFWRLVAALNANPLTANFGDGPVALTGNQLVRIMFRQLYAWQSVPRLPAAIAALERGDAEPLRALVAQRRGVGAGQAQALYYAIQCAEDLGTLEPGWREKALAGHERLAGFYQELLELSGEAENLCAHFDSAPPDPRWRAPVVSDTPALLLAGAYDPITPPAWRERAAEGLRRSYGFTLRDTGHAVVGRGACPAGLIRAFLDNPAASPDGRCVEQIGLPAFR
ncbi:MAG: alpha/beta fold hydrolase [Oscillochloridaceae bacterium]|nr:alpha/beta hydrolase [Chloroflexaceae bacterium]MDW8391559.1 alpha/beta fold hydrolase [Oscillochloridaceae bacterium]